MAVTAHLVIFLDRADTIVDVGVYSEPHPTCTLEVRPVSIVLFEGPSYREACEELRAWVRANYHILTRTLPIHTEEEPRQSYRTGLFPGGTPMPTNPSLYASLPPSRRRANVSASYEVARMFVRAARKAVADAQAVPHEASNHLAAACACLMIAHEARETARRERNSLREDLARLFRDVLPLIQKDMQ